MMKFKLTIVLVLLLGDTQAQTANRYDIVIDEIMVDPTPAVGLPAVEFIELKNISAQTINLNGWRIGDAAGMATINKNYLLAPDSLVIICANSAVTALSTFGATIGVSNFPSLDNNGEQLYLMAKDGKTIHAIEYSDSWYNNPVKKEGGWTLEMIDTKNACSAVANWAASIDVKGGTPGKKNAVDAINNNNPLPALLNSYTVDSTTIALIFDSPLDSLQATTVNNYNITPVIGAPSAVTVTPPFFNIVLLKTSTLLLNNVYNLTIKNSSDCKGNSTTINKVVRIGRSSTADSLDVVINEILFNPKPDGVDYIEIYNRSNKIIDLKNCYIANRTNSNTIGSLKQISTDSHLFFPQEYMVITENATAIKKQYLSKMPDAFAVISTLPAYPNDKGNVVILNAQGKIIDEIKYAESWHFKLVDNKEGVSLERINYNKPTQDENNWHSAATNVGYGTPTYQNTQINASAEMPGDITITAQVFSPDNDGVDDIAFINYQFPEQGYIYNITIFDASGKAVRYLKRNAICGLKGYFTWDGLDEKNIKLPIGVYVIYSEVFNLKGKTKHYKQAITLARRL